MFGLIGVLVRLALLPFRLALRLLAGTLRLGLRVGGLPIRATRGAAGLVTRASVKVLGIRAAVFLLVGVAIGLLLAPEKGSALRARLLGMLRRAEAAGSAGKLDDAVTFELAHDGRTWDLDQPAVEVVGGEVTLRGAARDPEAAEALVAVAAAVPGVTVVHNRLTVRP